MEEERNRPYWKNFSVTQPGINLVILPLQNYHLVHVVSMVIPEEILSDELSFVACIYLYTIETNLSVTVKSKIT